MRKRFSQLAANHQLLRKDYQKLIGKARLTWPIFTLLKRLYCPAVTKELTTGLEMVAKAGTATTEQEESEPRLNHVEQFDKILVKIW